MNRIICLLPAIILLAACSAPTEKRASFEFGQTDSLHSEILKENRKFYVYVPNADGRSPYTAQHYPVLYVLDADDHFAPVAAMVKRMSETMVIPEMIVVGVPNTDRSRDLTTSNSLVLPGSKKKYDWLKTTGGADAFTAFLEKELMPYVEKKYPTAPHRVLAGHSFGGLFAVNALLNHPGIFKSYIIMDPSMWWDERKLLMHTDSVLARDRFDNTSVFLSVANTMKVGMDTSSLLKDTAAFTIHIRSILSLAQNLKTNASNGIRSAWKYYDRDDHGSVTLISEYDGLRFIFDYYRPRLDEQHLTPDGISSHFKMVSSKIGYDVRPSEYIVEQFASDLGYESAKKALPLFELNTTNYPESARAFTSLGEGYLNAGDTAKAIGALEKSLTLKDVPATRDKLKKLKKEKS